MAKMTKKDLNNHVERYLELQSMIKELTKESDAIKDALKEEARNTEARTLIVGEHSVILKECSRNSINVKEFTAAHPKLAEKFTKTTTYEMLTVK